MIQQKRSHQSSASNMLPKAALVCYVLVLHFADRVASDKVAAETLENYSAFFNFGEKKLTKLDKNNLENDIIKSKVDVLGEVFKKNIDSLKSWGKLDLVFLIDASSSVGEQNFKSELKFVKKLLSDVTVDYDHSRIAVVTFSSKNNVLTTVDEITEPQKENNKCLLLNKELANIQYIGGGTYTLGAFQVAKSIFDKSRNESKKILFLITDGYSNGGDPVPLANELKQDQVTIFTIGIRNGNYKELYEVSSSPGEYYSYLLDSFQEFESLARRALHVDIKSGDYVPLGTDAPCNKLCENGTCCDKNALCTCGTSTGHYTCLCQPGYYGSGLQNSCSPCPSGTFADGPNLCLPCPDIHHVTIPPANSIHSCKCKTGYRATKKHGCEIIKCTKLSSPEHGYFVRRQECGNVLNNACGVRCEVGYTLIGSSIRLCQTSGNWSGNPPSCQVKTCSRLAAPLHGAISCTHSDLGITYNESDANLPVDTVCTFTCEGGRVLIGSAQRTCLPLAQWDGLRASCKQVKCNKLTNIPYGNIEPKSCTTSKQSFGAKCGYSCQDGFKLSGPAERSCTGKHGTWSNRSNQTSCEDVTPPKLQCPSNIKASTFPAQSFGKVTWEVPDVTDNSGLNVSIWTKPAMKDISDFKFKIGKTKITYFAQDAFKNTAKCSFNVEIKDEEPPVIENCVDPVTFLSADKSGASITWDEPSVFDNSDNVTMRKSHEFGFFNIGLTVVTYTATDPSNNTNSCILNITVQESHCEPLPDPIFGHSECTSMNNGIQCVVTCQEGYAIPISAPIDTIDVDNSSTQFICQNSDPVWYSEENSVFPDCTVTEIPSEVLQKGVIIVESDAEEDICNDTKVLNELENEIRNDINQNLQDTCTSAISCNLNTSAMCENEEDSEYEERTNIIKREVQQSSTANANRKSRRQKRINVAFEVSAKVNNKDPNANFKSLSNIENAPLLKNNNVSRVIGIQVDKTSVICPVGFVRRKLRCVQCPKGTFHNTTKGACQSCALGYYNDKVAQSSCIICPMNYSTSRMHCKSLNDCKGHCPPGTHSRRKKLKPSRHHPNTTIDHMTLMPQCRACPIGFYQANYGQLSCRPCPPGYTTTSRRSVSINQCIPTAQKICDNYTNICNKGKCIADDGFYYSCTCERNYIGSHCETQINSCSSNPCLNEGICTPRYESSSTPFSCTCKDGFSGKICEEVEDKCEKSCYNNGRCIRNDDDEEVCICTDGFGGETCEIKIRFCKENICENNGKCMEQPYGYKCVCVNGFIGKRCNILPCDYKPCLKHFVCVNINETDATRYSYKCDCSKGFEGKECKDKIDYCRNHVCLNNGICINQDDGFSCQCSKTFYGSICEHKMEHDYILHFPRSGTTDFIKLDGFADNINEISVCLWMVTLDNFNYGTLLSYATYEYDNTFTLTDYTGLVLYINGQHTVTDIFLNDGLWHFFCVTWQSLDGAYNVYVDGKLMQNGTGLATGTTIEGGGKMVIGQEQDVLGGRFSQSESFLGKLAYLDVWKQFLSHSEIISYMNTCEDIVFGDLYAWAEIKNYVHGDIEILKSTFCKQCTSPRPLSNGLIEIVDNVAYYSCNAGFQITIPNYVSGRKCTKASNWEGTVEPSCKRIYCGYPGYVLHGHTLGRNYYYKDKITYICQNGYTLTGSSERICKENGTWYPEKPACIGIQCKGFFKPNHSYITVITDQTDEDLESKSDFDTGTQIEIACANGTKLEGESLITCLDNGTWDYPIPNCYKEVETTSGSMTCPKEQMPTPPPNGYAVLETILAYGNGTTDTVEFKCRHGYKLHGDNFTTCIVDGYWTEPNVSCDPIMCGKPHSLRNMMIKDKHLFNDTYYFGNMVTYECIEGYRIFGNNVIRCLANGKWTRMQAKCTRKSCYKPVVKSSTFIEGNSYLYLDQVTLICSSGNRYTVTCNSSGKWMGDRGDDC